MIRQATESDLPEIMRMGREFLSCTTFSHVPFDEETVEALIRGLIGGAGAVFVASRERGLCGMIAMISFPHAFNANVKAAQEFFWWIDKDKRGNGAAVKLLSAAEGWAKEQGCETVHMLALDALNGDDVAKLYERRGYVPLERTFVRSI